MIIDKLYYKLREVFSLFSQKENFDNIKENISASIPFRGTNLWILIFAIFIASLGLNMNSTAVIIGAMLISPLMGPIMGIGFSVGINDPWLLRKAIKNYAFATLIGLITSMIYFLISPISNSSSEILARTSPNIYDVLIAFFGGLAGIVATSSKLKGNVIPGVAIATALMPPLCTAGFGLATGQFNFFFGALYLYFINTVYIALSTFIILKVLDFPKYHFEDLKMEKRSQKIMWILVFFTLVPSIYFGYTMVRKNKFEQEALHFINTEAIFPNNFLLNKKVDYENREIELTYGGQKLDSTSIKTLNQRLNGYGLGKVKLSIKQGFNFIPATTTEEMSATASADQQLRKMLLMKSDSVKFHRDETYQIFKELKVQNSDIDNFGFNEMQQVNDSSSNKINVVIIGTKILLEEEKQKAITDWLRVRIKDNNAKVIFNAKKQK
ncbi:TIGR00341 family protein [Riemerella columbipharyngis]|uniref:TIGR00341 family protein n=1 Tax=Riemerella columbipharyngis TaxID=1071918 RepID=A0A1G6YWE3_9FLAO|nr:TIGR00341 family protein [Riemerella columbipharyngis]SDD93965.1 TIGR00341 family protein [Riemerella columbipharyngis]